MGDAVKAGSRVQDLDGLPVLMVEPEHPVGTALWLTHLGGSAEKMRPDLERLAAAGWRAVSFDPPGHGLRAARTAGDDPWELARAVLGAFRPRMWPLLGTTTLEALRVVDWAVGQDRGTAADEPMVVAGGVSMGGDVAVALAGLDPRVRRVAPVLSTPDWTRPGMRELGGETVLDQGHADTYAQWFYDRLDPITHLDGFRRAVTVAFECGAEDRHVPAEAAERFAAALPGQVTVVRHPGVGHLTGDMQPLYDAAFATLTTG